MKHLKIGGLLRLLGLALAALGFCAFLWPVLGGFLDLSNLFGMGLCLLLAGILIFRKPFCRLLARLRRRRLGRILLWLAGLATGGLLILLLVLSVLVTTKMQAAPEQDCRTLIVLGCQVRGETPSLHLYYRIEAAADYLKAHPDCVAVLSGGQGSGEEITEAECMYRGLTARGIAPERLYLEDASTNTRENLIYSRELMEREGLTGPVALVSNSFHMYRALRMAADQDIPAEGLSAKSRPRDLPAYILREAMALIKYALTKP